MLHAKGTAGQLAIRYVVEGSHLGARILYRRAVELGCGPDCGARYLADGAARSARWHAFLAELEGHAYAADDEAHMCEVAMRTFELAHRLLDAPR
jgi:heme oxygenase